MDQSDIEAAHEALRHFRAGWATGAWKPFIEMLAPEFIQRVPIGELRGRDAGRDETVHHFGVLRLSGVRLQLGEPTRTAAGGGTVFFEVEVHGQMYGRPYDNRLALSFDVAGGKLTAMREYFGELDLEILREALR